MAEQVETIETTEDVALAHEAAKAQLLDLPEWDEELLFEQTLLSRCPKGD